jgi:uncharacterized membrane protein YeaQ/YmgE (transglycosylase-associated protein family)
MNIFWFLLVGLVAGWLAEVLTRKSDPGLIITTIYGIVGAFIGGFIFSYLGLATGSGFGIQVLVATAGAVILIVVLRVIRANAHRETV